MHAALVTSSGAPSPTCRIPGVDTNLEMFPYSMAHGSSRVADSNRHNDQECLLALTHIYMNNFDCKVHSAECCLNMALLPSAFVLTYLRLYPSY